MKGAKEWFYGIYGIQFIWRGAWSDPELIWHGQRFNYYDLEDALWSYYHEECEDSHCTPCEDDFPKWVKVNAALARDILQNMLDSRKGQIA